MEVTIMQHKPLDPENPFTCSTRLVEVEKIKMDYTSTSIIEESYPDWRICNVSFFSDGAKVYMERKRPTERIR